MFKGLKDLFASKKFWLTIVGSALYAGLIMVGLPEDQALSVLGLFGVNVIGQAYADGGKEAAKVEAELASKTAGLSPAEKAKALTEEALGDDLK